MEHSQFCEHAVKKKLAGPQIAARVGLIALYVLLLFVSTMLGLVWGAVLPCAVVALLIDLAIHLLLWKRTQIEYEYAMTGGVLTFSRIYGKSARHVVFSVNMKELQAAFPYGSAAGERLLGEYAPEVQHFALATQNAEDNKEKEIWCCIFEDEDEKTVAFYFELTDNAYRFLKIYASGVTEKREPPRRK